MWRSFLIGGSVGPDDGGSPQGLPCQPAAKVRAVSKVLLLRAQARGTSVFWVDVAMKREAKLNDLDRLFRRICLECCGHLSEFYGDGRRRVSRATIAVKKCCPRWSTPRGWASAGTPVKSDIA